MMADVGECIVTEHRDGDRRWLTFDRADPRIMVSAELLEAIAKAPGPGVSLDGDILRIEGADRTVIYRIGEKVPDYFGYYAEWPD